MKRKNKMVIHRPLKFTDVQTVLLNWTRYGYGNFHTDKNQLAMPRILEKTGHRKNIIFHMENPR